MGDVGVVWGDVGGRHFRSKGTLGLDCVLGGLGSTRFYYITTTKTYFGGTTVATISITVLEDGLGGGLLGGVFLDCVDGGLSS